MSELILVVITDDVMMLIWALYIVFVLYVIAKTKVPQVAWMILPGVAWLLFYTWTHFGLWTDSAHAVAWSRVAHIATVWAICSGLWSMVKASRKVYGHIS